MKAHEIEEGLLIQIKASRADNVGTITLSAPYAGACHHVGNWRMNGRAAGAAGLALMNRLRHRRARIFAPLNCLLATKSSLLTDARRVTDGRLKGDRNRKSSCVVRLRTEKKQCQTQLSLRVQ